MEGRELILLIDIINCYLPWFTYWKGCLLAVPSIIIGQPCIYCYFTSLSCSSSLSHFLYFYVILPLTLYLFYLWQYKLGLEPTTLSLTVQNPKFPLWTCSYKFAIFIDVFETGNYDSFVKSFNYWGKLIHSSGRYTV